VRWLESLAAEAVSLDAYLREIARFPELTGTEERHLSERVQRRDDDALARLVASQLALVLRYAQQYQYLGVPLEQFDRRQEAAPLQPVFVQRVRRNVRGRNERDPFVEQVCEQLAEDHRIADVRDEKFVETQYARFVRQTLGHQPQRIRAAGKSCEIAVHTMHEAVKVRAQLFGKRHAIEEQIHQEGLAAPNASPYVQSLDHFSSVADQSRFQAPCQRCFVASHRHQSAGQVVESNHCVALRGVVDEPGQRETGVVLLDRSHRPWHRKKELHCTDQAAENNRPDSVTARPKNRC
jgi:hypothetical protein